MYPNSFEPPSSSGGGAATVRVVVSCRASTSASAALRTKTGAVCMRDGAERPGVTIDLLAALVGATACRGRGYEPKGRLADPLQHSNLSARALPRRRTD